MGMTKLDCMMEMCRGCERCVKCVDHCGTQEMIDHWAEIGLTEEDCRYEVCRDCTKQKRYCKTCEDSECDMTREDNQGWTKDECVMEMCPAC